MRSRVTIVGMDDSPPWFKSSHSSFASSCVEVGFRGTRSAEWIKSSHSSMENGGCVEASLVEGVSVLMRDTRNRESAVVGVRALEWSALVTVVAARR